MVLVAVLTLVEVCLIAAIFITGQKLIHEIHQTYEGLKEKASPVKENLRVGLHDIDGIVNGFDRAIRNLNQLVEGTKYQVLRLNGLIECSGNRERAQKSKASEVVTSTTREVKTTWSIAERAVLIPLHEGSAVVRAVWHGLRFWYAARRRD